MNIDHPVSNYHRINPNLSSTPNQTLKLKGMVYMWQKLPGFINCEQPRTKVPKCQGQLIHEQHHFLGQQVARLNVQPPMVLQNPLPIPRLPSVPGIELYQLKPIMGGTNCRGVTRLVIVSGVIAQKYVI